MSSKLTIVVIAVAMAILLGGLIRSPASADETVEFEYVRYSPDPVVVGEPVEFSCKLSDDTNVSMVTLNICTVITCLPPMQMHRGKADGVYIVTTTDINTVEEYHFNVVVKLDNGSTTSSDYVYFTPFSHDLAVTSLDHSPAKVKKGETVDVYVSLESDENVSTVQLFHCQGDVCYPGRAMEELPNGTYHVEIGPFDKAEEVKYNVTVQYTNGFIAWTADSKFTPQKKGGGGDDDDDGFIPAVGAVAAIAVLAGFAATRRTRRR